MRDFEKLVLEYEKKFEGSQGRFTTGDLDQLLKIAKKDGLLYALNVAIEAGYVVGYKTAMRDSASVRKDK